MKISKLIEMLEKFLDEESDMEIFIYERHGDRIKPKSIQVGSISRGRGIEDYAFISDTE